jgi:hypothetical protein
MKRRSQTKSITSASSNHQFGYDIDVSGDYLVIGAPVVIGALAGDETSSGLAYIYSRSHDDQWAFL